ncbi:MAG: MATE family efflux transporter [Alphaproteobacteria bacterium]
MEARFTQGSIMRHIAVMSFTSAIGLATMFVVNFVDLLFIARIGNQALAAAAGYAGTILFFTQATSIGFSISAGTLIGRSLGEKRPKKAREYGTSILLLGLILYIPAAVILWFAAPTLLHLLGARGDTLSAALIYLHVLVPSIPFVMISMLTSALLRARGDAKTPMNIMVFAGIVNAILDPIFIFDWGLGLGIQGAALATFIARFIMMSFGFYFACFRHKAFAPISIIRMRHDMGNILSIAVPAVLTNFATPVGSMIMVKSMSKYGDQIQAALAVINQLVPVAFGVVFALSGAIGPIIAQNYGAKKYDRIKQAIRDANIFNIAWVIVASISLILMHGVIIRGFKLQGEAVELVFLFCSVISFSFIFVGAVFVSNACFNSLGYPFYSTALNWVRNTIALLPFVMLGDYFMADKGIVLGQAVGNILVAIIAVYLSFKVADKVAQGVKRKARIRDTFKKIPLIQALYNHEPPL